MPVVRKPALTVRSLPPGVRVASVTRDTFLQRVRILAALARRPGQTAAELGVRHDLLHHEWFSDRERPRWCLTAAGLQMACKLHLTYRHSL